MAVVDEVLRPGAAAAARPGSAANAPGMSDEDMADFSMSDDDSSSDDDLAWPPPSAAAAAEPAEPAPAPVPAPAPAPAPPAAAPSPAAADPDAEPAAAAPKSLPSAWVPPRLPPVQDAVVSAAATGASSAAVGRLRGLRTGTIWPACAAGWCPQPQLMQLDAPAQLLLAVGTYLLEEESTSEGQQPEPEPEPESKPAGGDDAPSSEASGMRDLDPEERERQRRQQQRSGTIRIYQVGLDPPAAAVAAEQAAEEAAAVRQWQTIPAESECGVTRLAAGALDIKWCPWRPRSTTDGTPPSLLGVACADGSVRLLELRERAAAALTELRNTRSREAEAAAGRNEEQPALGFTQQLEECAVGQATGSMALSLAWAESSSGVTPHESTPDFVSCHADGHVRCWEVGTGSTSVSQLASWHAHELETWAVATNPHAGPDWSLASLCSPTVFTGADDSSLKGWAVGGGGTLREKSAVMTVRGAHTAGVTVLSVHPTAEHVLASGSYDETVHLWDIRMLTNGVGYRTGATPALAKVEVGGGVWRLCWHPQDPSLLAAAVMHGGVRVLHCGASAGQEQQAVGT